MKKILFNDKFLLTKAVIEGRKTQTRGIVTQRVFGNIKQFQEKYYDATFDYLGDAELLTHFFFTEKRHGRLPYNVGEVVAIAQRYRDCGGVNEEGVPMWDIISSKVGGTNAGWDNKRFVKAELMPHQIRITDVRIEKLQDISDKCCLKEGVIKGRCGSEDTHFMDAYYIPNDIQPYCTPREAFAHLINKVSREDVWSENPYVFVYDFELVK